MVIYMALPWRMQFDAVVVNFDLINELNMDEPEYDWTISTFVDMAKKATTTKYSGINYIYNANQPTWGFDNKLMGAMYPDGYQQYGYGFDTHSVDLTDKQRLGRYGQNNSGISRCSGVNFG